MEEEVQYYECDPNDDIATQHAHTEKSNAKHNNENN